MYIEKDLKNQFRLQEQLTHFSLDSKVVHKGQNSLKSRATIAAKTFL